MNQNTTDIVNRNAPGLTRRCSSYILRWLAVVAAVLCVAAGAAAQKLIIEEAHQAMEPMTVPMQRLDFNNQICALVKVVLPVDGVQFEGNVVGEPVFKTSEYWVYLTPGTKMMKIKAPGHYPVMADFRELGLGALESKAIYYLTVVDQSTGLKRQTVTANYAVVTVQPPTAMVKIDGQLQPIEDGSVIALLKLGQHTWQAEASGYYSDSGSFQITAAEKTNVSIQLRSQKSQLKINTLANAEVYVNDQRRGTGSQTLELMPGMYNVELRLAGHMPFTQTIELKESRPEQVNCTEFTPLYGMLNVNYRPIGATITLNGRQVGTAPANLSNILVGTYNLAIASPGYTTHTQQINITEDTPVNLSGSLQKQTTTTPTPAASTSTTTVAGKYSTTPVNLALCAELNGRTVYITQEHWNAMPASEKSACKKKGVCIIGGDERFLLALNDSGEKMSWTDAMVRYGNSLPTKEQGDVMSKNYQAINIAIIAFGGDKDPKCMYWTRTDYDSSHAWVAPMYSSTIPYDYKPHSNMVRTVAPLPNNNTVENTASVTPAAGKYSTTPVNLALCAELNGRTVYITHEQWNAMPASEKSACKKKGVCVIGGGERFLLALNDSGEVMKWKQAMSRYGNSLPTKEQGDVMSKNNKAINAAIIAFGGDKKTKGGGIGQERRKILPARGSSVCLAVASTTTIRRIQIGFALWPRCRRRRCKTL